MDNTNEFHRRYGRHSGIPDCCIRYFMSDWSNDLARMSTYAKLVNMLEWGYVPCFRCVARGNQATIKQCEIDCGGNHVEQFLKEPSL